MARRYDVIVIGAGAMGSATAWWLARRGVSVLLLERFEQGHRRGSSHGGSRIFRFAYPDPEYVRLAQAALGFWREAEADTGVTMVEITGAIDYGHERGLDRIADALSACDTPFERLSAVAAAERFPGFRFETSVLFHPDGGRCLADAAVRAFQDSAAALGVDVRFEVGRARLVLEGDGVEVAFGDEQASAGAAVVTAGAWAKETLGTTVRGLPPLTVTQEQIAHYAPVDPSMEWPSFIDHSPGGIGAYGLHTPGEGVKVGRHMSGAPTTGDARDFRVDAAHTNEMTEYVRRWLPGLISEPVTTATCLYTTTPTEDFVIDRQGPVVVGSPCSGHGFKFTPLIGRMLADLAQGKPPPIARFRLKAG